MLLLLLLRRWVSERGLAAGGGGVGPGGAPQRARQGAQRGRQPGSLRRGAVGATRAPPPVPEDGRSGL